MLTAAALATFNWYMMQRPPPPPRALGPWHHARIHEDDCKCERCGCYRVNGWHGVELVCDE